MDMKPKRYFNFISFFIVAAGFFGLFFYICYIMRSLPIVPYMDTLKFIQDYGILWEKNPFLLFRSWPYGQQSGLIDPAFTYINIKLFSLNSLLASISTGFVIFIIYILLAYNIVLPTTSKPINISFFLLILIIAISCFSLNGWQLYDLDLGMPEYFRNLTYLAIAIFANRKLIAKKIEYLNIIFYLFGLTISILFFGMGEVYSFSFSLFLSLLFAYSVHNTKKDKFSLRFKYNQITIFISPLFFLTLYFFISRYFSNGIFSTTGFSFKYFLYLPRSIATTTLSAEAINSMHINLIYVLIIGYFLLISYLFCLIYILYCSDFRKYFLPFFMSTFGLLTALSIVIARGPYGPQFVMVSRYYVSYFFFFVGLILMLYIIGQETNSIQNFTLHAKKISRLLLYILFSIFFISQLISTNTEWHIAPYRSQYFQRMEKLICQKGNLTSVDSHFLQADNVNIANAAKFYMKKYSLGPFRLGGKCN
ncbi:MULTISPECIES: hypothetical protein [Acidithiobacillus]|uniref:hypothetical protein n=1 Tax=Acidithiobacillus TaxID=119977 RepID=UPI001C06699B|nr:hypothetical protein [Acidithiobacillus thiooxidans]MBU2751106.1 hypothetical protein [Acidithiobacillus thiooxidans]